MSKKTNNQATGIMLPISFVVIYFVNAGIIYLANTIAPNQVVLGTHVLTKLWAVILSMSTLALINTFAIPLIRVYEKQQHKMLSNLDWTIAYFVINFLGLWLVSKAAEQLGLGLSAWWVALVLAIILDLVQGVVMMGLEKVEWLKQFK